MTGALVLALLAFVLAVGAAAALFADPLAATVAFGAYSLGMSLLWVAFRAPDVALTEAAVGAGVTSALFLVVLVRTDRTPKPTVRRDVSGRAVAASVALVVALGATLPALPAVGDPTAPAFDRVPTYYLRNAPELGVDNVVTAVLVAYRGFDTFGEVVVVFAAGLAAVVALGPSGEGEP